jgi:hypothetical protein
MKGRGVNIPCASRLLAALALACGGCCGGGDDSEGVGSVEVRNQTPYFVHFLHPDHNRLYVEPGASEALHVSSSREITILIAPGQEAKGMVEDHASCCSTGGEGGNLDCASVVANWDPGAGQLSADVTPPQCAGGSGSCPYVYSGTDPVLQGESLVGALNRGAARHDVMVLSPLLPEDGSYRVRIAAELDETDYIDAAWLALVDHPAGSRIAKDSAGNLRVVRTSLSARRASDTERELGQKLDLDDGAAWEGKNPDRTLDGKIRDWIEIDFPRPPSTTRAILLVRGRNTHLLQDAYHEYLAGFGPGLKKLMRLTTSVHGYRSRLDRYLAESGFSLEVAVKDGEGWRAADPVKPVGPAAEQTIAVPLELPADGAAEVRVRLAMLPGAWIVDSARISFDEATDLSMQRIDASSALRTLADSGKSSATTLQAVSSAGESTLRVETGDSLVLQFPAPAASKPPAGLERTAVLHVVGYYEENDRSPKPCINWKRLLRASHQDNSFARHVLDRLSHQKVVDRYAEEAGVRSPQ